MQAFLALLAHFFDVRHAHHVPADHGLGGGGYASDVWECTPREGDAVGPILPRPAPARASRA